MRIVSYEYCNNVQMHMGNLVCLAKNDDRK